MKERFLELARSIDREGNEDLLEELDKLNFYTAPASTSYHLSEEGGLVEHSVNVCEVALKVNKALGNPLQDDSIKIASLYHDIGKAGFKYRSYYEDNILKSGEPSKAKPYRKNKDLVPLPHEILSILIIEKHMEITQDELWSIVHHNGLYGDLRYNLMGKELPLQILIHFSDMWSSRVIEV